MPADRERLAREQEALVRSLVLGGPIPEGFDAEKVARAARSLVGKRRREVARAWPAVAASLGAEYRALFDAYAARTPPHEGGPLADGRRFARTLPRVKLDDAARLSLLRWGWTWLPEARSLAVALPWLGTLVVPLPGRRRGGPPSSRNPLTSSANR